jgi:DMSO reductase anchor subunit
LLQLILRAEPGWPATLLLCIAALSHLAGLVVERWLFFAEAKHTVTLYYGARAA